MQNGETVMKEGRDVAMAQVQEAKQQEFREITQMDLEDQESGAGEELGLLMEGSPQAISEAESVNASQPTSAKRPKKKVERRGSRSRHRSTSRAKATLKHL
jgi:hypothetical protein